MNYANGAAPLYASNSDRIKNYGLANAGVAKMKADSCPTKTRIEYTNIDIKPSFKPINSPRLPNGRYRKLQALVKAKQSKCAVVRPITSSTAVAATWTRALDVISISPTMCSLNTAVFSDLFTILLFLIIFSITRILNKIFKTICYVNTINLNLFYFLKNYCPLSCIHINNSTW